MYQRPDAIVSFETWKQKETKKHKMAHTLKRSNNKYCGTLHSPQEALISRWHIPEMHWLQTGSVNSRIGFCQ